jgi:hypothetical protein
MQSVSEKGRHSPDIDTRTQYSSQSQPRYGDDKVVKQSYARRMVDSFKRDPARRAVPLGAINGTTFDPHAAAVGTAESALARKLKGRHLQMIAIGGSIGMLPNFLHDMLLPLFSANVASRYRSFRSVWQGFGGRRTRLPPPGLLPHWYHVVLYRACSR